MLLALAILIIIISIISDKFFNGENILNILRQVSIIGIVALGVTFVVIGGTFDMSVGSTVSLTGLIAIGLQGSLGVIPAILVALLVGAVIGAINGTIINAIRGDAGDSFIITFGMLSLVQAIALIYSKGFTFEGSKVESFNFIGQGKLGFIPMPALIFVFLAVVMHIILSKTSFGIKIQYMGASREVARLSGINVGFYKIITYVIAGFFASIAAIVLTARIAGAPPKAGLNYEFEAVTAIVLGGVGLRGGEGTIINTIIGVLFMGVLNNGLNLVGVSTQNQMIVTGLILIAAVCIDRLKKKN